MPKPGQYREVLVPGLAKIGEIEMSKKMEDKVMMLAISGSILGAVQVHENITPLFIDAMESVKGELGEDRDELINYYVSGLKAGRVVPVVNNCDEINADIGDKVYASGELFFST